MSLPANLFFSNVSKRTRNAMCCGDWGGCPMYLNTIVRGIRYCMQMCRMSVNRLSKQAYLTMLNEGTNVNANKAGTVEQYLSRFGFGYVWFADGGVNEGPFCRII